MQKRTYLILFILEFSVLLLVAHFQPEPGYMDADFYEAGGIQLLNGKGFSAPFLWNYLDDPSGIPHPSNTYWMPLTSIIAWVGKVITRSISFHKSRIIFIVLSSLLSPLTAYLAYKISKKKYVAILAGMFAVFSGFYFPFLTTSDSFAIYWLLGGLFFITIPEEKEQLSLKKVFALGMIIGFMHLTRGDGLMWMLVGISLIVYVQGKKFSRNANFKNIAISLGVLFSGYLLLMGSWMFRNLRVTGSLLNPYLSRSLWINKYDELFNYPASSLTIQHWLSQGISEIFHSRLWALGINLQRFVAEQGMIFLNPFILIGAYRLRKDLRVKSGMIAWVLTIFVMTIVFPFAGARGGFFHSSAAIQPLFYAVGAVGIDEFINWGKRKRGWQRGQAIKVFGSGFVLFAIGLTIFVSIRQIYDYKSGEILWGKTERAYETIDSMLVSWGAGDDDIVMVGNPPGYFVMTGRRSIVIPNGNLDTLLNAARKYHADYLVIDQDHPEGLNDLYNDQWISNDLHFIFSYQKIYMFKINVFQKD